MRLKTEAKRDAIVAAAAALFLEQGFDRVSMAAISEAVGGSKATLYGYFKSKEELFVAAIEDHISAQADGVIKALNESTGPIRETLLEFARIVAQAVVSPEFVAVQRASLSVAARDAFGPDLYQQGPSKIWHQVGRYLQRQMDNRQLRQARADVAVFQLKGLIESGIALPALYDAPLEFPCDLAAEAAVDTFMRAYAPDS